MAQRQAPFPCSKIVLGIEFILDHCLESLETQSETAEQATLCRKSCKTSSLSYFLSGRIIQEQQDRRAILDCTTKTMVSAY